MSRTCPARRWFQQGRLLEIDRLPAVDFQMHSQWTDGRSPVGEMIRAADAKSLRAMAITEHVNSQSAWYPEFVAEVKAERQRSGDVAVYFGAEIAAADYRGGLKADPSQLEAELILGVVHRLPKEDGSGFWSFDELRAEDAIELEIRALTGLASNRQIDVIGHPGGIAFKKFGAFPVEWMEPVFCAAREHGIAVELNTKYLWDLAGMLALLRRVDPLVSFGSDAHEATEVGSNFTSLRGASAQPRISLSTP
ncbi:MAG TPA: PHP domain-containing protein [Chthoniobacteraceae bacterium]|nr:hypothetical protein [Chthoniobacter sp.]HEV7868775.1 PHP domain-containing protein [Chthoniobacteraceae bacterium]